MTLERLQEFVTEANLTNSSNDKKKVIAKYPDLKEDWNLIYDTINYQYFVTSANLKKNSHLVDDCPFETWQEVLQALQKRDYTGHAALGLVNGFTKRHPEHRDLVHNIIDRNLKTRTDISLINKVFPKCVPEFSVALAATYDEKTAKVVTWDGNWACSRKLDGIRCIAIIDENGKSTCYSRSGKEILTLGKVNEAIESLNLKNFVFDGEICMIDDEGNEHFQGIMKQIRKKDHTIPNPKFKIFDGLCKLKFEQKSDDTLLFDRYTYINEIVPIDNPFLSVLEQVKLNDVSAFEALQEESKEGGWEGLILRKNAPYQGKRSKDLLKVKEFFDAEYVVEGLVIDTLRHIDPETGLDTQSEMLSRVNITHKGNTVGVGSGFTIEERQHFFKNPNDLIGKVITVCYFEESQDEKGNLSLRFPTVKVIHGRERTT